MNRGSIKLHRITLTSRISKIFAKSKRTNRTGLTFAKIAEKNLEEFVQNFAKAKQNELL